MSDPFEGLTLNSKMETESVLEICAKEVYASQERAVRVSMGSMNRLCQHFCDFYPDDSILLCKLEAMIRFSEDVVRKEAIGKKHGVDLPINVVDRIIEPANLGSTFGVPFDDEDLLVRKEIVIKSNKKIRIMIRRANERHDVWLWNKGIISSDAIHWVSKDFAEKTLRCILPEDFELSPEKRAFSKLQKQRVEFELLTGMLSLYCKVQTSTILGPVEFIQPMESTKSTTDNKFVEAANLGATFSRDKQIIFTTAAEVMHESGEAMMGDVLSSKDSGYDSEEVSIFDPESDEGEMSCAGSSKGDHSTTTVQKRRTSLKEYLPTKYVTELGKWNEGVDFIEAGPVEFGSIENKDGLDSDVEFLSDKNLSDKERRKQLVEVVHKIMDEANPSIKDFLHPPSSAAPPPHLHKDITLEPRLLPVRRKRIVTVSCKDLRTALGKVPLSDRASEALEILLAEVPSIQINFQE